MGSRTNNRRTPSAVGSRESQWEVVKGYFPFWDVTKAPSDNADIAAFVGSNDYARGVAIAGFDPLTNALIKADAFAGGGGIPSIGTMDPHGFMCRVHDGAILWTPRSVADHTHAHSSSQHRGTIIGDSSTNYSWGWLSDMFWICDLGAPAADPEIQIDKSGLLPIVTGINDGQIVRGAVAHNMAKNAGYITDGLFIGQHWHTNHISDVGGGGTVTATPGADRPKLQKQGTLRGDVYFDCEGQIAPLHFETGGSRGCNKYKGFFIIENEPASTKPPGKELRKDVVSDQLEMERKANARIVPVVKIRAQEITVQPTAPTVETPAAGQSIVPDSATETGGAAAAAPSTPTVATGAALMGSDMEFEAGEFVGFTASTNIPSLLLDDVAARVEVPMGLPAAATGGTDYNFALQYTTQYNDPSSASTWSQLTKTVSADDLPTDGFSTQVFDIPNSALSGKAGGHIAWALYQLSDSDGDQNLQLRNPTMVYPGPDDAPSGSTTTSTCYGQQAAPAGQ